MKEVNIAPDAKKHELDFSIEKGGSIRITSVDAAGKEVASVSALGLLERDSLWQTNHSATVTAIAFGPSEKRTLLFHQKERNIGQAIRVEVAGESPKSITVKLEPCATIRGKLVDGDNRPVTDASLRFDVLPSGDFEPALESTATDANGQFEHKG